MTKRYSDTLRERADEVRHSPDAQSQCEGPGPFLLGWAAALYSVSVELDSPEFSGRIVYEQRNAALEEAKRWEAEANEWRRLCHELVEQVLCDVWCEDMSEEMKERLDAIRVKQRGPDETNAEDDNG